jgi:hypothetical protein
VYVVGDGVLLVPAIVIIWSLSQGDILLLHRILVSLFIVIGEYYDYYGRLTEDQIWALRTSNSWQIIPVIFQKRHREMLQWAYTLMSERFIKIHPSLQNLIVSLTTAIVSDDWKLDKHQTSHHDILDSFRLALCNYELPKNL